MVLRRGLGCGVGLESEGAVGWLQVAVVVAGFVAETLAFAFAFETRG